MVCLHTDTMGVHPACILFDGQGYSPPRPGIPPETTPPILHILPLIAHQLASARKKSPFRPHFRAFYPHPAHKSALRAEGAAYVLAPGKRGWPPTSPWPLFSRPTPPPPRHYLTATNRPAKIGFVCMLYSA